MSRNPRRTRLQGETQRWERESEVGQRCLFRNQEGSDEIQGENNRNLPPFFPRIELGFGATPNVQKWGVN